MTGLGLFGCSPSGNLVGSSPLLGSTLLGSKVIVRIGFGSFTRTYTKHNGMHNFILSKSHCEYAGILIDTSSILIGYYYVQWCLAAAHHINSQH